MKIVLTGGGTAGHVTPNLALIEQLTQNGYDVEYIGSLNGMEKEIVQEAGVKYHGISSGKMRRYLSAKNFTDLYKIIKGLGDARRTLKRIKPDIVFSKGGFVIVPVVYAARMLKIPVVIHESDMTPGLANKLAIPFASAVCVSFPETANLTPKKKTVVTGSPIRESILSGNRDKGLRLCGFNGKKPVLLMMGGSTGSVKLNTVLRQSLIEILPDFDVVHLCGKGNFDSQINKPGYKQFEYVSNEMADLLACADVVVSRAGANSISELLAMKKPNLLIPLSKKASRGDQIQNAKSFSKQGFSMVLEEEHLEQESLVSMISELHDKRDFYTEKMSQAQAKNGVDEIIKQIIKYTKNNMQK